MKEIILLKIGGALITDKNKRDPTVNKENLQRIVNEIKEGFNPDINQLILIHGAGSYGHPIVKETGIDKGIKTKEQVLAFAKTQKLQNELNAIVCEKLEEAGLPAIPFQPSASAIMKSGKLISLNVNLIRNLLNLSLIPVLYGVPAYDEVQGCSILSGDQIITYLAKDLKPARLILATNVPGVLNEKNEVIKQIDKNNFETIKHLLRNNSKLDVTGGMYGKVEELLQIKNITSEIIGGKPGIIKKALKGEKGLGTLIIP
ncbi:MAG: isopentenyl phosphate kinase [Promethearchaeota archaeon]